MFKPCTLEAGDPLVIDDMVTSAQLIRDAATAVAHPEWLHGCNLNSASACVGPHDDMDLLLL